MAYAIFRCQLRCHYAAAADCAPMLPLRPPLSLSIELMPPALPLFDIRHAAASPRQRCCHYAAPITPPPAFIYYFITPRLKSFRCCAMPILRHYYFRCFRCRHFRHAIFSCRLRFIDAISHYFRRLLAFAILIADDAYADIFITRDAISAVARRQAQAPISDARLRLMSRRHAISPPR